MVHARPSGILLATKSRLAKLRSRYGGHWCRVLRDSASNDVLLRRLPLFQAVRDLSIGVFDRALRFALQSICCSPLC